MMKIQSFCIKIENMKKMKKSIENFPRQCDLFLFCFIWIELGNEQWTHNFRCSGVSFFSFVDKGYTHPNHTQKTKEQTILFIFVLKLVNGLRLIWAMAASAPRYVRVRVQLAPNWNELTPYQSSLKANKNDRQLMKLSENDRDLSGKTR